MSVPVTDGQSHCNLDEWRKALDYKSDEWDVSTNGFSIKGAITVEELKGKNIYWLYVLLRDGKIDRLEGFLQRPILERIWKEFESRKCLEFLTSAFLGTSTLDGYIFVPTQLVHIEIEKYIQEEKDGEFTDNDVLLQLEEMKQKVEEMIENEVWLLILDGQTRLNTSIRAFFESEIKLPVNGIDGKQIILEKKTDNNEVITVLVNNKEFENLSKEQQDVLKTTPVKVDIITSGSLGMVIGALIGKQLGIKWEDFQIVYLSEYISAFSKRIQDSLPVIVVNFLKTWTTIEKSPKFKSEINGHEYFHAILLYWMQKNEVLQIKDNEFCKKFKPGENIVAKSTVTNLTGFYKNELIAWAGDKTHFETFQFIEQHNKSKKSKLLYTVPKCYIILRNAMQTKKTLGDATSSQSVPQVTILSEVKFVDEFIKEHIRKVSQYTSDGNVNTDSWIIDQKNPKKSNGKPNLIKKPDGYLQALTDDKTEHYKTIQSMLVTWLSTNEKRLKKLRIIEDKTFMDSKEQILVSNDFKEMDSGDDLSGKEIIKPKTERGHKISRKNKGDNSSKNVGAQYIGPNRSQGEINQLKQPNLN